MRCRKYQKHGNGKDFRDGAESSFFDCWDWRHEQCDNFAKTVLREGLPLSEHLLHLHFSTNSSLLVSCLLVSSFKFPNIIGAGPRVPQSMTVKMCALIFA